METDEKNIVQRVYLSIESGGLAMLYDEAPLYAYPERRTDGNIPYYGYREFPGLDHNLEPVYVDADTFLECWKRNMSSLPQGWYHFTNKEGLEVFIDNVTGSGHMKAFDEVEDGLFNTDADSRKKRLGEQPKPGEDSLFYRPAHEEFKEGQLQQLRLAIREGIPENRILEFFHANVPEEEMERSREMLVQKPENINVKTD